MSIDPTFISISERYHRNGTVNSTEYILPSSEWVNYRLEIERIRHQTTINNSNNSNNSNNVGNPMNDNIQLNNSHIEYINLTSANLLNIFSRNHRINPENRTVLLNSIIHNYTEMFKDIYRHIPELNINNNTTPYNTTPYNSQNYQRRTYEDNINNQTLNNQTLNNLGNTIPPTIRETNLNNRMNNIINPGVNNDRYTSLVSNLLSGLRSSLDNSRPQRNIPINSNLSERIPSRVSTSSSYWYSYIPVNDDDDTSLENRGLTTEIINENCRSSIYHISENNENTRCAICQSDYLEEQVLLSINNCNHQYHDSCIRTWLGSHNNCPTCRGSVVSS